MPSHVTQTLDDGRTVVVLDVISALEYYTDLRTLDQHRPPGVRVLDWDPDNEAPLIIDPDTTPWMRSDDDLMTWIVRQGFDPKDVRAIELWDDGATVATFEVIVRDRDGRAFADPRLPLRDAEACTVDRIVVLWGDPPPYRTPSGTVLR